MQPREQNRIPTLEQETRQRLGKAQQIIRALEEEIDETNKGLIALTMELEERAAQLERAEERYRSIFENAVEGIFRTTPDGRFLVANPALARILGYDSPEELIATVTDVEGQLYVDADRRVEFFRQLEEHGTASGFESRVYRKDRSTIWVGEHTRTVCDPKGRILGYEGTIQDITARKETEQALRDSEQSYRSLFDSITEMVYIQDLEGRFLDANERVLQQYGYTREELIGSTPDMLADPEWEGQTELEARFRRAAEGKPQQFEWWARKKDGEVFPKEITLTRGEYFGEPVVIAVGRDISERKRAEAQLRQSQKMEAVGRLAGGIAHDFNNMLGVISGTAEMLRMDLAEGAPQEEDVEEILRAADRAADLTRQLLAFSRQQVLQPRVLNLNDVVERASKMLRRLIGEDVELVTALGPDLGPVEADPGQMEQVLMNLVVNARDAMPTGGTLWIGTENAELNEEDLRRHTYPVQPGRYVLLSVRDTGVGMSSETLAQIFEPFFTTKEAGKGTGLGLSTVYGIVKQSGGHIRVDSEVGRGTTFRIYLPRVESDAEDVEAPAVPGHAPPGNGTVLLVEDEPSLRRLARRVLERHGYTILDATNGEEALRVAQAHEGDLHLVVTDVVMPRMSGPELVQRLADLKSKAKVLYTSGYMDDAVLRHGVAHGETAFLQKPFSTEALAKKVREVLEADGQG